MKVWNYVFIAITMMLLFQFSGIGGTNNLASFVSLTYNADNSIKSYSLDMSDLLTFILTSLTTWAGVGIAVGLYFTGKADIAIKAGIATSVFTGLITTFYFPLTYALTNYGTVTWLTSLLAIIFIPFSVGFIYALFEYIIGGNTD